MYNMQVVTSSLFCIVCFPHNGKIVTIDQMTFKNPPIIASSEASVLKVEHSQPATGSVGVGMYPSLMGTFSCLAPVLMIGSSFYGASTSMRSVPFHTSHMGDPWILPSSSPSSESIKTSVPLPVVMIAYQDNLQSTVEPCSSSSLTEEEYPYVLPAWEVQSSHAHDCLDTVFLQMKRLLRLCWELSHHGRNFIIDHTFFQRLTIWSMRIIGRFLVKKLVGL